MVGWLSATSQSNKLYRIRNDLGGLFKGRRDAFVLTFMYLKGKNADENEAGLWCTDQEYSHVNHFFLFFSTPF
jgi:hypothetical protein